MYYTHACLRLHLTAVCRNLLPRPCVPLQPPAQHLASRCQEPQQEPQPSPTQEPPTQEPIPGASQERLSHAPRERRCHEGVIRAPPIHTCYYVPYVIGMPACAPQSWRSLAGRLALVCGC